MITSVSARVSTHLIITVIILVHASRSKHMFFISIRRIRGMRGRISTRGSGSGRGRMNTNLRISRSKCKNNIFQLCV